MADYPPPPPGAEPPSGATLPPRTLGEILSSAFEIYRENAGKLLTIVAIIVVPLSILNWLITRVVLTAKTHAVTIGNQTINVRETRSFGAAILAALVSAAIGVIVTALLQAATLRGAAEATIGDPVDVEASYRYGLRHFGSVLLVAILVGLAVGIGFIFLIIPGIIFLGFFAVAVPAVVVEDRRGTGAMGRSWNLVKGHFWHVLGVVVVAAIITGVVSAIFSAIGSSNKILALILGTIGQIITTPFSALVTVLLYLDLRARVENLTPAALRSELQRTE